MIAFAQRRCDSTLRKLPASRRPGAALLEGTIVLAVFLTIIFAMFDIGLAVMRQNSLAEAARRLARTAILLPPNTRPGARSRTAARPTMTTKSPMRFAPDS